MTDLLKHLTTCFHCKRHFCTDEAGTLTHPLLPDTHICCNHKASIVIEKKAIPEPVVIHRSPWTSPKLDKLSRFINEQDLGLPFEDPDKAAIMDILYADEFDQFFGEI